MKKCIIILVLLKSVTILSINERKLQIIKQIVGFQEDVNSLVFTSIKQCINCEAQNLIDIFSRERSQATLNMLPDITNEYDKNLSEKERDNRFYRTSRT